MESLGKRRKNRTTSNERSERRDCVNGKKGSRTVPSMIEQWGYDLSCKKENKKVSPSIEALGKANDHSEQRAANGGKLELNTISKKTVNFSGIFCIPKTQRGRKTMQYGEAQAEKNLKTKSIIIIIKSDLKII